MSLQKQQKTDSQAEEIKELKSELNRITEFLKPAASVIKNIASAANGEDKH